MKIDVDTLIKAANLFTKVRHAKAIKVSRSFYNYVIKSLREEDVFEEDLSKEDLSRYGYMAKFIGIPIIIDDDVETYKIEYEGE